MAPGLVSPVPGNLSSSFYSERPGGSRQVSTFSANFESDSFSQGGRSSRRESFMPRGKFNGLGSPSDVHSHVQSLYHRSGNELGAHVSSRLMSSSYESLGEWIRIQRMSHLPAEGSHYDKVLSWASLFIDRLREFDEGISQFSDQSFATQLSYGYCRILLELGKENAYALMTSFGFFYSTSATLVNLLERTELFGVSQEIKEQLLFALGDLVTLIHDVSTYYHRAISDVAGSSVSVNIYDAFHGPIFAFKDRCAKITEAMWRHQLSKEGLDTGLVSTVKNVHSWLAPEDRVLSHLAENTSQFAHEREEMTCIWAASYLTNFLKSPKYHTLAITGKQGSGKTVTASVLHDRLQHPIGGDHYKTLYVPINARVPAETTPIAIAKTILFQLFEKRIGNVKLLNILAEAYEQSKKSTVESEYQGILWTALELGLAAALRGAKQLVIVVDGLDEATGGEAPILQSLLAAVAGGTGVKLITLGAEQPKATDGLLHVPITEDRVAEDISIVVRANLEEHDVFLSLSELEQETIIDQITEASHGSFLWAKLASKRVRHEKTQDAIHKTLEKIVNSKAPVNEFVLDAINSPDVNDEVRQILLWLATADRPFTLKELSTLASIDVTKLVVTDRALKPKDLAPVNNLVFIQDGQVGLRHGLIRSALLDIHSKGKLVPKVKDHQADFVTRLFIYIKSVLPEQREPSLLTLDHNDTSLQVQKNPLLDFAVRYWPRHLTKSTVYTTGGEVPTAKEFSKIFPATITLILLQNTLWRTVITPTLVTYQKIVTNFCRTILTPESVVTLQSMISLAFLYRDISLITDCIPLFYDITIKSRDLLKIDHLVTMKLATLFIELTTQHITTSRTDIMIKREEILILAIESYKIHYGQTSEQVITTLKTLEEHYRKTQEEKKLLEITNTIRTITTSYHGGDDGQSDLRVHLKGRKEQKGEVGIRWILEAEHDESIETGFDYEALVQQAEKYRAEGKITEAERIYVEIWQRTNKECRIQSTAFWEETKLKAVLAYSKFLKHVERKTEASSILSSVYEEHRHSSLALTETSSEHYKEIATVMASVGLTVAALNIRKHVAQYYKSTSKSSLYEEMEKSISISQEEVMQSSSSSSSTSESTLVEIIEESFSSGKIDHKAFHATSTLIKQFTAQHRWKDSTSVIKKALKGLWPALFAPTGQDVTLPAKNTEQAIEYAELLANCYHYRRRFAREENIRVRLYRAVRAARPVDDKVRERVTEALIHFFDTSSQPDKVISTRQEILDDYTKHFGPEHPAVIKILWILADLTRPRPVFVDYYQRIIQALNKGSNTCKPEALKPLVIVATELWTQGRYNESVSYYTLLFTTFLSQPKHSVFEKPSDVQDIFTRYTHCLRSVRTSYEIIHKVTVDYQTKVKAVFGATASITIQATLTLARVCQESKRYEDQAVFLYEELRNSGTKEIDLNEVVAILDGIYEEQTSIAMNSSEGVSKERLEAASNILRKRIITVRKDFGWTHEESLSQLKKFVSFQSKYSSHESVLYELKEATVNSLREEHVSSTSLVTAAAVIASSYIATNQVHKATEMSEELYRQIVMKDTTNTKTSEFDLTSKGRQSLVFLAQLEHSIRQQTTSITEILASLTTEYVYFEEFRSYTSSKTASVHTVTLSAARLYYFLLERQRLSAATRVFDEFVAYFLATEGKRTKLTNAAQVKIFLNVILEHFNTHKSSNFVRSVGIASNLHVVKFLEAKKYEEASNLAIAAFLYISASDAFNTSPDVVKFVFTLGITVTGRTVAPRPEVSVLKKLQGTSTDILQKSLRVISALKINLSQVSLEYLNILIGVLGEQKDYNTLVWLLSSLWASRNEQVTWRADAILGLARRFILARFLNGDLKATRLAEDIVYNCRRVNGAGHSSTLEMSTLLTQLYTGIAQHYQTQKDGQHMANKYYKKSANLHENLLRILIDPEFAEFEGGLDQSFSLDGSAFDLNIEETPNGSGLSEADHVRQHLNLLKLSVQRLGSFPKDASEYERLNKEVFEAFGNEIDGAEGIEKWNLKGFGSGKAAGKEDTLVLESIPWELELGQTSVVEEEL